MQRKKVRCIKRYEHVAAGVYNYQVFIPLKSGWSNNTLATCKNCGEMFVIDWENPRTKNLSLKQIAGSVLCPSCGELLSEHLASYPATIRLSENRFGSFKEDTVSNEDEQSEIVEFYELRPVQNTSI